MIKYAPVITADSTDGLRADFGENFARHANASYDFGRTHASYMHALWLLAMHNNHHGILDKSENVVCSCALIKKPVR